MMVIITTGAVVKDSPLGRGLGRLDAYLPCPRRAWRALGADSGESGQRILAAGGYGAGKANTLKVAGTSAAYRCEPWRPTAYASPTVMAVPIRLGVELDTS